MVNKSKQAYAVSPLAAALELASSDFVLVQQNQLGSAGVLRAVTRRDPAPLFDWLVGNFALQGISDRAAIAFQQAHGRITWVDVQGSLQQRWSCPRLRSWWHFQCGYRKALRVCAEPDWIELCDLPKHNLRKGVLNEAAYGLALFIRDICDGDLVSWIDQRLFLADRRPRVFGRGRQMTAALVGPLSEIPGTGPKIWSMLLADLLLAADPQRERWVTAGASMIAVDTLVHAWLHRTGALLRYGVEHPYGSRCYGREGCADVIKRLAQTVDARSYNPAFPAYFPRFIQVAIWQFCAETARNICNGRQIDDRTPCQQVFCPARDGCARIALHA